MTLNNVNHVCDIFLPGEERPINKDFLFYGEEFCICTYRFMRGWAGLQGEETPNGYFITSYSPWLDLWIDVYPEKGLFTKRIGIKKAFQKNKEVSEMFNAKAPSIEAAFINAIVKSV